MVESKPAVSESKLILIAGPSGGGKTTFAHRLLNAFGREASLIPTDNYYRPLDHLSVAERAQKNFDHPDSLEFELLIDNLSDLLAGRSVDIPTYDFATHARNFSTARLVPTPYIIVEGILALVPEELRRLASYRIFVSSPLELCLARRIERDIVERGRTKESIIAQWNKTVLPMYEEFGEASKKFADVIIAGDTGNTENESVINSILQSLRK